MEEKADFLWAEKPVNRKILHSFENPRTPVGAAKRLSLTKIKLKPYIEKGLLKPLNPEAKKGKLYVLTDKGRALLNLPKLPSTENLDWDLIGWVAASQKQRMAVLETIAMDSVERTSEAIRRRAARYNECLTRISTKGILKELLDKGLVNSRLDRGKRYYGISEEGKNIADYFLKSATGER